MQCAKRRLAWRRAWRTLRFCQTESSRALRLAWPGFRSSMRRHSPLQFGLIVINGGADEILQSTLANLVALGKIDRSPHLAFEARIEELVRIRESGPVREGKFHLALEDGGNCDQPVARPRWASHPLPTFGDLVVGRQN